MLRLLEVGLFLAPFAAFGLWRLLGGGAGPSNLVLGAVAVGVALLAAALIWLSDTEGLRRGTVYVPAELKDGRIVPGHAGPR